MVRCALRTIMRAHLIPALILLLMCTSCNTTSERLELRVVSPDGRLDALNVWVLQNARGPDWAAVKLCPHGGDMAKAILVTEVFDMTRWAHKNPVSVSWKNADHLVVEVDNGQVVERIRICEVAGRKIKILINGPKKTGNEAVMKEVQVGWEDYYRCHPEIEVEFKMKKHHVSQRGRTP